MNHEWIVRTRIAERYQLEELPPEECDAFEAHFFECEECAEEVCFGQRFADNVAVVFHKQGSPVSTARKRRLIDWFAWMQFPRLALAAACLALVTLAGYQNVVVIPHLRSGAGPAVVPSVVLVPASRGRSPEVSIPAGMRFFHLALDLAPVQNFEAYACDLRSGSGASIWKLPVAMLDPEAGLHLIVPGSVFVPGSYDAVLLGMGKGGTRELSHYRFAVRRP